MFACQSLLLILLNTKFHFWYPIFSPLNSIIKLFYILFIMQEIRFSRNSYFSFPYAKNIYIKRTTLYYIFEKIEIKLMSQKNKS